MNLDELDEAEFMLLLARLMWIGHKRGFIRRIIMW